MPVDVLRSGWNIDVEVSVDDIGLNNYTWKVGDTAWLTRYYKEDLGRVLRELELCEYLSIHKPKVSEQLLIDVPECIRTKRGDLLYEGKHYFWKLTRHMKGVTPSQEDPHLYPVLAHGLGLFHRQLRLVPASYAVSKTRLIPSVQMYTSRLEDLILKVPGDSALVSVESENIHLLKEAAHRVSTNVEKLSRLPVQLIHGDFSHPNLRVKEDKSSLIGALDLEFCSLDPVLLDLATVILTLIARSKLVKPFELLPEIIKAYEDGAGGRVDLTLLEVAIVARKFDSYWHHRNRLIEGKGTIETFQRQLEQLKLVLSVLVF